jgi:uncharacterized protein YndB with AHSA1/START domain
MTATTGNSAVTGNMTVTYPSDTQILVTREFDAPADLLYEAWTTPELIKRWWSGERGVVTIAEVDLRVGGTWRHVMLANGGFEVAFHGEYRELVPGRKIVSTEVFEGAPDAEALTTMDFVEHEGRTTLQVLIEVATKEQRDAMIATGMAEGFAESLNALETVAQSLR